MTRTQFIRRLRRIARKNGLEFELDNSRGAGSHYIVRVGDKRTTVQSDLNPRRIERIMKQLGLK
ncbi:MULTISPECIES: type II toxin-antitoxin system HicA family toxin [unclassified Roseitalea]|uniref:type II toxin-antitoxin system HicA family toxin n=1 Tax=unclassified Roseitalea TaxID=2639107 RepID=UPI00273E0E05|nr:MULTISPECIES: type II toxin-antitoxin system HicA family toxin [unclassified Roseitalea]